MPTSWYALRKTPNRIYPRGERHRLTMILRRNRSARRLIAGYTCHCWELLRMWSWTPAFFSAVIALSGNDFGETAQFGAYFVASMHLVGAVASVTMGRLADLLGRRVVLVRVAAIGTCLSMVIGWLTAWPIALLLIIGLVYYFFAIGDSPVLSTALTEVVEPGHLGSILAVRSIFGFGAGGIAPLMFGTVLDLTNSPNTAPETWVGIHYPWFGRPQCDTERESLQGVWHLFLARSLNFPAPLLFLAVFRVFSSGTAEWIVGCPGVVRHLFSRQEPPYILLKPVR